MLIKRNDAVITRIEENGEAFIFNTITGQFKRLNRTGAYLWDICPLKTLNEIVSLASKKFTSVQKVQLETDITEFFKELHKRNLIDYQN